MRNPEHLLTMNAAMASLPVSVGGQKYEVVVAPEGMAEQLLKLLRKKHRVLGKESHRLGDGKLGRGASGARRISSRKRGVR